MFIIITLICVRMLREAHRAIWLFVIIIIIYIIILLSMSSQIWPSFPPSQFREWHHSNSCMSFDTTQFLTLLFNPFQIPLILTSSQRN